MTLENAKVIYKNCKDRNDEFHAAQQLKRYPELEQAKVTPPIIPIVKPNGKKSKG